MRAAQLRKRPRHFKFTGLSIEQFEGLVKAVTAEAVRTHKEVRPRQRAVGGGRKAKLELEDQLVVTLIYYRLHVTQIPLGYLFDLDDSNVSRVITKLRPLLLEVLPLPVQETLLFATDEQGTRKRISTLAELLQRHPEFKEVLVDATEQETNKPKNKAKRKGHYSGKKKRHTFKTQVVVLQQFLPNETQIMRGLMNLEEEDGQATKDVECRDQRSHCAGGATRRSECR